LIDFLEDSMADEVKPVAKALPAFPAGKWKPEEEGALREWAKGFDHVLEPNRTALIRERFENGPPPAVESVVR